MRIKLRKKQKRLILVVVIIMAALGGTALTTHFLFPKDDISLGKVDTSIEVPEEDIEAEGEVNTITTTSEPEETTPMTIDVIDVGEGQSVFIDYGDMEILFDAGSPNKGKTVVEKIRDKVDGPLDYVIATTSDKDHVGGLPAVYKAFSVENTIYGYKGTDKAWTSFESIAKDKSTTFTKDSNTALALGEGATLTLFDIPNTSKKEKDDSVCALLSYNGASMLITGDASSDVEEKLAGKFETLSIAIAGNHGADTSGKMLGIWAPEYVAVSAGENNSYGYPQSKGLSRILQAGTAYGTWKTGDITFTLNGVDETVICSADEGDTALSEADLGAKVQEKKDETENKDKTPTKKK